MSKHRFHVGEVVTIFQSHPKYGLEIEGPATIMSKVLEVSEYYIVRFHGEDGKPSLGEEYERFVDTWGQNDPAKYAREWNTKRGITAKRQ